MSDILRRSSYAAGYNRNSIQSDSLDSFPTPTPTPRRSPSVENNYHDRLESLSPISLPITPSPTKLRLFFDRLIEKIQVVMPNQSRKHSAPSLRAFPTPTPTPLQVNNQDPVKVGRDQETVSEQDKDYADSLSLPDKKEAALDKEEREKAAKSVLKEILGIHIKKGHINREVTLMLKALETAYDDSKSSLEKSSAIIRVLSILQSSANKITENSTEKAHKLVQYYKDLLPGGEKFAYALVITLDPEKSDVDRMSAALDLVHTGGGIYEKLSKGDFQYKGYLTRPLTFMKAASIVMDEKKPLIDRAYAMAEIAAEGVTSYDGLDDLLRSLEVKGLGELARTLRREVELILPGLQIAKKAKGHIARKTLKRLVTLANVHPGAGSAAVASLITTLGDDSKTLKSLTKTLGKIKDPEKQKELLVFFGKAPKKTIKALRGSDRAMAGILWLFRKAERASLKDFSKTADLIGPRHLQRFAEYAYLAKDSNAELLLVATKQNPTLAPLINGIFGFIEKKGLRMTPGVAKALTLGFSKAIPGIGALTAAMDTRRYLSLLGEAKNLEQALLAVAATATNGIDVVSSAASVFGAPLAAGPDAALALVNMYLALHNEYIKQEIERGTYKPPIARAQANLDSLINLFVTLAQNAPNEFARTKQQLVELASNGVGWAVSVIEALPRPKPKYWIKDDEFLSDR